MSPDARGSAARLLVVLVLLQGGCFAESELGEGMLKCSPRESTVECCLKQNPGQWEKCTGSPSAAEAGLSGWAKGGAGITAAVLAVTPAINSAERRGVELATDLRAEVEAAILRCARRADREANDHHFDGRSPSQEECKESKREGQTWAMYLGQFKHTLAWQCLRDALGKLVPGRYLLEPRFVSTSGPGSGSPLRRRW